MLYVDCGTNFPYIGTEDQIMEKKTLMDIDALEEVPGGAAGAERIDFRMDVYRGETYMDYVPCLGYPTSPAINLRQCIRLQNNVSLRIVHIYLPSGPELNYEMSFAENGICDGIALKACINE